LYIELVRYYSVTIDQTYLHHIKTGQTYSHPQNKKLPLVLPNHD